MDEFYSYLGTKRAIESLQVQVAIEHGYEVFSRGYQDIK